MKLDLLRITVIGVKVGMLIWIMREKEWFVAVEKRDVSGGEDTYCFYGNSGGSIIYCLRKVKGWYGRN